MLLSAAAPLVALIDLYSPVSPPPPLVPGLLAVPVRYATSLSVLPRMHGVAEQLADVVSVGVTGETVKHSGLGVVPLPSSLAPLTPAAAVAAFGVNVPNQQYRPTDVSVAKPVVVPSPEGTDFVSVLLVKSTLLTRTPWASQTPLAAIGPQR